MAANQVVRIGDIGFLFQPEVIDYLAASNEEIPDGEEHARLFLADRLHLDSTGLGVFLAGRKVAVLAARGGFSIWSVSEKPSPLGHSSPSQSIPS